MNYNEIVAKKMEKELSDYKKELLAMPPEEILDHCVEYVIKQDIFWQFQYMPDLPRREIKALSELEKPLEEISYFFEKRDFGYNEALEAAIKGKAIAEAQKSRKNTK